MACGSWQVPHHIRPLLASAHRLLESCSDWLTTLKESVPWDRGVETYVVNTSSRRSPGWKSAAVFPGLFTRTTPDKWHCSQTLSRSAGASFRGFTIDPGAGSFRCAVVSPWQRSHEIASSANAGDWYRLSEWGIGSGLPEWHSRHSSVTGRVNAGAPVSL